ncbi:MAG: hypothetical protein OK454_09600, partial [Thaumarchaeota archaeon]|nr:hypothetical protein [Nitrososphaerota archaeon]
MPEAGQEAAPLPPPPRRRRRAISVPVSLHQSVEQDEEPFRPDSTQEEEPSDQELPPMKSGTTADDGVAISEEPSDTPAVVVVVSERPVRKRRYSAQDIEHETREIKSEDSGSDAIVTAEMFNSPHESIDLDAGRPELPTPKKQRRSLAATEADTTGEEANDEGGAKGSNGRSVVKPERASSTDLGMFQDFQAHPPAGHPSRRRERHLDSGVAQLAEDGNPGLDRPRETASRGKEQPCAHTGHGRLGALLDCPSTASRRPLLKRQSRGTHANDARLAAFGADVPAPRALPFDNQGNACSTKTPKTTKAHQYTTPLSATSR